MCGQQVTASGPLNATMRARAYLAKLGVAETNLDALLAKPVQALIDALDAVDPIMGGGVYFGPVLDMKWLTRHPFWPDANPQSRGVPMMLGNVHDETRAFISPESPKVQGLTWDNLAERMAPELRIDILPEWVVSQYRQHFPNWPPADGRSRWTKRITGPNGKWLFGLLFLGWAVVFGVGLQLVPHEGANSPYGGLGIIALFSGFFSSIVPDTSKTIVRGPVAERSPSRSEPGPLSSRFVT